MNTLGYNAGMELPEVCQATSQPPLIPQCNKTGGAIVNNNENTMSEHPGLSAHTHGNP
jgi:hypothetical protein